MKLIASLLLLLFASRSQAQSDYKIEITLKNYPYKTLLIGYEYGSQKYPKDTLTLNSNGQFVFEGKDSIKNGLYFIVLQPKNEFLEFIIDYNDHHFAIAADAQNVLQTLVYKNSSSNQLFKEYEAFLKSKQDQMAQIIQKKKSLPDTPENQQKIKADLKSLDTEIGAFQADFIKQHKGTFPALIAQSLSPIKLPSFTGSTEEILTQSLAYQRAHFWDNIDFDDKRLLYTNFFDEKMTYYMNEFIPQHPDTISQEMDVLLTRMTENNEMYQYYLVAWLNKYAHTVTKGLDAVYVHLVKNYFAKGKSTRITEDQLASILRDVELLEPVLIGKKAPNITLYKQDGSAMSIYDSDKPYTLLFFWGPDCGHCQKAAPYLVKFFDKYKDQVEVITICNEIGDEKVKKCWQGVTDHEYNKMINLADPKYTSSFKTAYYVKMTPTVYILNKDKIIIAKNILAKELSSTMERLIAQDQVNPSK